MRVVSWNMGYWTPARFKALENRRRQWSFLLALDPDVMLLQECRPSDFEAFTPSWAQSLFRVLGPPLNGRTASSAIVARSALNPEIIDASDTPWFSYLGGLVVRAQIAHPALGPVRLASVHALAEEVDDPCLDDEGHQRIRRPGCERAWNNDLAAEALRGWIGARFIVGGDWNTARHFDETYPGKWPNAGHDFFDAVASWGWRESMRKTHPSEVQTYLKPASEPYQLDHLFTDECFDEALVGCGPADGPLVRELSDHAPVIADFDLSQRS